MPPWQRRKPKSSTSTRVDHETRLAIVEAHGSSIPHPVFHSEATRTTPAVHSRGLLWMERPPSLGIYDGTSDLDDHIENIKAMLNYCIVWGVIKCRLFPTTFRKGVTTWYKSLASNSIHSWCQLKVLKGDEKRIRPTRWRGQETSPSYEPHSREGLQSHSSGRRTGKRRGDWNMNLRPGKVATKILPKTKS